MGHLHDKSAAHSNTADTVRRRCDRIHIGASHTTKQAGDLSENEVFSRPNTSVFGAGSAKPQGWQHNLFCVTTPSPTRWSSQSASGFQVQQGTETMSTSTRAITPTNSLETVLRSILAEVSPGRRPFSSDSFLPDHLIDAALLALAQHDHQDTAAQQHAFNALSTAAWHCARGEPAQALARIRRAQSHIKTNMGASA